MPFDFVVLKDNLNFQISISYSHTIGTRVRLSLMRSISKRQKEHDANAVCSVSSFTARPMLRVGGKDTGTRFLTFVDAVLGFKHLLTQEDIDKAASLCQNLKGHLKSRFIVISDDRTPPPPPQSKKRQFSDIADVGNNDQLSKRVQHPSRPSSRTAPGVAVGPAGSSVFSPSAFPPLVPSVHQLPSFPPPQQQLYPAPGSSQYSQLPSFQSQLQQVQPVGQIQVQAVVHQPGYFTNPEDLSQLTASGSVASDVFKVVSGRGGRRQSQRMISSEISGVRGVKPHKKTNANVKQSSQSAPPLQGLTEELEAELNKSDSSTSTVMDVNDQQDIQEI